MNLGLALYGRSFTLANSQNTSIGAPIIEGGGEGRSIPYCMASLLYKSFLAGPYTKEEGILAYFEVMIEEERMKDDKYRVLDLPKITRA